MPHFRALCLTALALFGLGLATPVPAAEGPSGLPLPRFVSTRSNPINVRVGPGTRYSIAWVFMKAGTPVEIIQEFDTWRKVRYVDGSEGWLHQNLLQGKRSGLVAPWRPEGDTVALFSNRDDASGVRAWLGPNFRVDISECDRTWCKVIATSHPKDQSPRRFDGYMRQAELWGVYEDEVFN